MIRKPPRTTRCRDCRRGVTAVEFAITAPIFFLFLLASFEFGWLNVVRHTADNAAYEAARHAMVPGATAAEARAKANSLLSIIGTRGADITVTPTTINDLVQEVSVQIDISLNRNCLIIPRFTSNKIIRSSVTLKTERAED